jgi:hypothetical protein
MEATCHFDELQFHSVVDGWHQPRSHTAADQSGAQQFVQQLFERPQVLEYSEAAQFAKEFVETGALSISRAGFSRKSWISTRRG